MFRVGALALPLTGEEIIRCTEDLDWDYRGQNVGNNITEAFVCKEFSGIFTDARTI